MDTVNSKQTDYRNQARQKLIEKIANEKNPYKKRSYEVALSFLENKPEIYFGEESKDSVVDAYNTLLEPLKV